MKAALYEMWRLSSVCGWCVVMQTGCWDKQWLSTGGVRTWQSRSVHVMSP